MSSTAPIAELLEGHTGKKGVAGLIPGGGIYYHFEYFGEGHTNEIKHDIHPQQWVDRDRFNIKTSGGLYDDRSSLTNNSPHLMY